MTLQSSIVINEVPVADIQRCRITNSLGNEQSNSDVEFSMLNPYGRNGSRFSAGQAVDVYIEDAQYKLMPETLKSGLIGYWRLDDKNDWSIVLGNTYGTVSAVKDSVGNYGDGTNTAVLRATSGKINACSRYSANATTPQISIPVTASDTLQNPDDLSVSFWAKFDSTGISGIGIFPIQAVHNTGYNWYFFKTYNVDIAGKPQISWYLSDYVPTDYSVGFGSVIPDEWAHVVGTYHNGSQLSKLYINNNLVGSLYGQAKVGSLDNIQFGDSQPPPNGNWYIDEVSIFDKVLDTSEIGSIYNNGSGISYGNRIFSGRIEDVTHYGEANDETIELGGRDWGGVILDKTVQPEVYTNLPAGSIVRDVMNKYASEISIIEVGSGGTVIDRIAFNQVPVFDAIKQLADYGDQDFYVDETKKLRFRDKNSISSQRTYNTADPDSAPYYDLYPNNVLKSEFRERRDTMYNQVWVYGDRYLDGYKESFTQTAGLGSVFTLSYNPHNTEVTVNGSIWQPGGIFEMTDYPISGIRYLVDYNNKQVIFSSGTTTGDYLPKNGSVIVVNYKRSLPVVKVGDNEASKIKYGTRVKVIQDKSITDPLTAEMIMLKELENYSDPLKEGTLYIRGIDDIKVGETANLNIPQQGINTATYEANEVQYTLDDETMNNEHIMRIKFNKHLPDITDQLRKIMMDMRRLQSQDMTASDLITRYQFNTGSIGIRQDYVRVMPHSGATWEDAWVDHNHHYEDYLTGSDWIA